MARIIFFITLAVLIAYQVECASLSQNFIRRLRTRTNRNSAISGSLARRSNYQPAATTYTWWTWSSTDGYKSGTGKPPPSSSHSRPTLPTIVPTPGSDAHEWLQAHNKWRSKYGVTQLKWSEDLVSAAKVLTNKCVWKHTQNNRYGENMAAGQSNSTEVVDEWVTGSEERGSYSPSSPTYSHFTQVVWADTTQVGCTMTTCKSVDGLGLPQSPVYFWACEYNPPGNVIGQFAKNVKAADGGAPLGY